MFRFFLQVFLVSLSPFCTCLYSYKLFFTPFLCTKESLKKKYFAFFYKNRCLEGLLQQCSVTSILPSESQRLWDWDAHFFLFFLLFFVFFCVFVSATHYLHGHAMSESKYPCASGATPKVWSIIKDISKRHAKSVITSSRWSFDFTKCFRSLNSTHNDE